MTTRKEDDIKVRVPSSMRAALAHIAQSRMTTVSEIAREALLDYLAARNITVDQLHDAPGPAGGAEKPTTYRRKASKADTQRKILDIVEKRVKQAAKSPPPSK